MTFKGGPALENGLGSGRLAESGAHEGARRPYPPLPWQPALVREEWVGAVVGMLGGS